MKKMKRLVSVLLAAVMVMATAITVSATTPSDLTIISKTGDHTYEVYQLLTGKFEVPAGGTNKVIVNPAFGDGVTNALKNQYSDVDAFMKAIEAQNGDGEKVLALLEPVATNLTNPKTVTDPYALDGLDKGYYLIKDKDNTLDAKHDAYTKYILLVVDEDSEKVVAKMDIPEVEKKVKENSTGEWNDVADYNIGDPVPFKLTTTIINAKTVVNGEEVSVYDTYKTYTLKFVDDMSPGLSLQNDLKVFVEKADHSQKWEVNAADYQLTAKSAINGQGQTTGTHFEVLIPDTKTGSVNARPGDIITVEFSAILNEDAKRMYEGNPNKVYLEFSNNPNDEGNGEPGGKTPPDEVIVFTYDLPVEKIDGDSEELIGGAKFRLYKTVNGQNLYAQFKAPDEKGLHVITNWVADESSATILITEKDKPFGFKGLDQGIYYLEETEAPAGYNMPANPVTTIVIKATETDGSAIYNNEGDLEVEVISVNEVKDGKVVVENNKGVELPETGGIGTTVFYVIGAMLMLGAGVILVTRRRLQK